MPGLSLSHRLGCLASHCATRLKLLCDAHVERPQIGTRDVLAKFPQPAPVALGPGVLIELRLPHILSTGMAGHRGIVLIQVRIHLDLSEEMAARTH